MAKPWAAYVRTSTDKQEDNRQRKAIREKAKEDGRTIPDDLWLADQESRDQWERRPGILTLQRLWEQGHIEGFYIEKFDRLGVQDDTELGHRLYEFRRYGVRVISTVDGEITSPDLATKLKTFFQAKESEAYQLDLGRKVQSGKLTKTLQDKYPWQGGIAPFGFDKIILDSQERLMYGVHYTSLRSCVQIIPCADCRAANRLTPRCPACQHIERTGRDMPKKSKTGFATLVPSEDQERVEIVRNIFKWYTTQAGGLLTLTLRVNAQYRVYGKKTSHDWVGKVLRNPAYVGAFSWGKSARSRFYHREADNRIVEMPLPPGGKRKKRHVNRPRKEWVVRPDCWQPLIDQDVYEKAQAKLEQRQRGPRIKVKSEPWLGGLLYCGTCKKPMGHREGYNATSRGKLFYRCTTYAAAMVRHEPCECGCNTLAHEVVEPLVLDYFKELKIDLASGTDREAVLKLYAAKGEKEDLLAATIRKGLDYYAARIYETFRLGERSTSKLAKLVAKLCPPDSSVDPDYLIEVARAEGRGGPADGFTWNVGGTSSRHPFFKITTEEAGMLVREIEETKAVDARQELDQLQGEFDTLTRAKALAESERERRSLQSQLARLEERMEELEEHLTPLARRRDELREEIEDLKARIELAERAFAEGDNLRKAQAVRDILGPDGMIVCHFEYHARLTKARPSRQPKSKARKRCEFRGIEIVLSSSADDPPRPRACALPGLGSSCTRSPGQRHRRGSWQSSRSPHDRFKGWAHPASSRLPGAPRPVGPQ